MAYDIRTDVPTPSIIGRGSPMKYPFRELPVGGSFCAGASERLIAINAAFHFRRRNPGWNCTTRKTEDGGVRIWRIA
jgi:hypothetical protein